MTKHSSQASYLYVTDLIRIYTIKVFFCNSWRYNKHYLLWGVLRTHDQLKSFKSYLVHGNTYKQTKKYKYIWNVYCVQKRFRDFSKKLGQLRLSLEPTLYLFSRPYSNQPCQISMFLSGQSKEWTLLSKSNLHTYSPP